MTKNYLDFEKVQKLYKLKLLELNWSINKSVLKKITFKIKKELW